MSTTKIPVNYEWTVKRKLKGHKNVEESLAISQEGLFISCSGDRSIKVWYI